MSQGGYSINLEKCCYCGRPYRGEGTAVFQPEKGGIACLKCRRVTALAPGMSPDTVAMIRLIQSKSTSVYGQLKAISKFFPEVGPVLKLHREYRLGMRPKTANYMG